MKLSGSRVLPGASIIRVIGLRISLLLSLFPTPPTPAGHDCEQHTKYTLSFSSTTRYCLRLTVGVPHYPNIHSLNRVWYDLTLLLSAKMQR